MLKKKFHLVCIVFLFLMLFSINAFAGSYGKTGVIVCVNNDFEWHSASTVSRSGNYSYVSLWCNYVIPNISGVSDEYKYVQVTAKNANGIYIGSNASGSLTSSHITMKENASSDSLLYIIEGHLNDKKVYLYCRDYYTYVPVKVNLYYKGN